jgi:cardiolipin synthase
MWKSESLFFDGDAYFRSLLKGISDARATVEMESYIFEVDDLGTRVLAEVVRAAQRGVAVRLLVDGFGSFGSIGEIRERLRATGVKFRVYHVVGSPWRTDLLRWLGRLNRRNHRKSCIVDGEQAWVGSFNISDVHCSSVGRRKPWRDTGVSVTGGELGLLRAAFERAWNPRHAKPHGFNCDWFRLNDLRGARKACLDDLIRRICHARTRVWLTTPYFVPTRRILHALKAAAASGADVRLLVPEHSDVPGMTSVVRVFLGLLGPEKVSVFLYQPSILHAKVAIIDNWASVGSSNLNHRSLLHDLEVDLVLRKETSLDSLSTSFLADQSYSRQVETGSTKSRSVWERLIGSLGFQFRSWL